ncbi:carbon-nitrogen hydrolase family protein [Sphingosinicella sp.]|uniref:carbon-nitrogen hydrolase family protein n=1 Tax=Sphingosinicella sp. TaxID=1917971 RepID=UPI0035ADA1AD
MKVTLIQLTSHDNKAANIVHAENLLRRSIEASRPDLVALPEVFTYHGGTVDGAKNSAETIPGGPAFEMLCQIAREYGVYVHGGSIGERDEDRFYNTTPVINPRGELVVRYRKIHMFDVMTPDGKSYQESATFTPGSDIVTYDVGDVRIGCTICYDLRFGELFVALAKKGVQVIILPAAFTMMTGKDHWEALLRARAIETQCYVLAPGQVGSYFGGGVERMNYGNSMIIDPWGTVIARAQDGIGFVSAELDLAYLEKVRSDIPSNRNRVLGG